MFSKSDYYNYFDELEDQLKRAIVIYTDLLNELSDKSVRNKLYAMAQDNMDTFRFIKIQKDKFKP